jgi:hypothetical protein
MARTLSRFADEPQMQRDEDTLDREAVDDGDNEPDSLDEMFHALREGDEPIARGVLAVARCLQEMVAAAHHDNQRALEHWYRQCRHVFETMDMGSDEEGGE